MKKEDFIKFYRRSIRRNYPAFGGTYTHTSSESSAVAMTSYSVLGGKPTQSPVPISFV
jgi:hypothetical protein